MPEQGCSGYKLETTALISIDNYNAFRITRIMLILEKLHESSLYFYPTLFIKLLNYVNMHKS